MPIYKLSDQSAQKFTAKPEVAMGVQIGSLGGEVVLIIGGEIAVNIDIKSAEDFHKQISEILTSPESDGEASYFFKQLQLWRDKHEMADPIPSDKQSFSSLSTKSLSALMAFTMPTASYVSSPPAAPSHIYGHLPFVGTTTGGDKFLRFEPWPNSRRLDTKSKKVAAGTYAAPLSERHLVPNGFAAVGRYALPNLLPACTVWEITPRPGTRLEVGACVPLFGQAGGGAEVCFTSTTTAASISSNPPIPVL